MIHVLAIITTHPGQRASVLEAFQANVPKVRAEAGCLVYEATVDSAPATKVQTALGPDTFVVVEQWASVAALEAHGSAPHMIAYGASVQERVAHRVIHVLSPV